MQGQGQSLAQLSAELDQIVKERAVLSQRESKLRNQIEHLHSKGGAPIVQDTSSKEAITDGYKSAINFDTTQTLDKKMPTQQSSMIPEFEAALAEQDFTAVRKLLAADNTAISTLDAENRTALLITVAAADISLDIVKLLLDVGVDVEGREPKDGLQAIHICAAQAMADGNTVIATHVEICHLIIEHGAELDRADNRPRCAAPCSNDHHMLDLSSANNTCLAP
jgi:hypothetical protein